MSGSYVKDSMIFLSLYIVLHFIVIKLIYSSILLLLMYHSIELKLYGATRGLLLNIMQNLSGQQLKSVFELFLLNDH